VRNFHRVIEHDQENQAADYVGGILAQERRGVIPSEVDWGV